MAAPMKIATFNINNINRRLPNLLDWLKSARPDIVCLQELKCTDREFPVEAMGKAVAATSDIGTGGASVDLLTCVIVWAEAALPDGWGAR
jgi:Endonuclease/Exonuclease/phosphatase family